MPPRGMLVFRLSVAGDRLSERGLQDVQTGFFPVGQITGAP